MASGDLLNRNSYLYYHPAGRVTGTIRINLTLISSSHKVMEKALLDELHKVRLISAKEQAELFLFLLSSFPLGSLDMLGARRHVMPSILFNRIEKF